MLERVEWPLVAVSTSVSYAALVFDDRNVDIFSRVLPTVGAYQPMVHQSVSRIFYHKRIMCQI